MWVSAAMTVLSVLSLVPYLTSSTEVVRMRNALLVIDGPSSDFEWAPASKPASFAVDSILPDPVFVDAARPLQLDSLPDDHARAVAIAHHMLTSNKRRNGEAIQSDLRTTYRRIVENGDGYCADFVRVFNAFAGVAGIPVRSWAFSFDGFGGHGHVFPEIWNRQLGRWHMVSVFDNLEFLDGSGQPLSALEFRAAMLAGGAGVRLQKLVIAAPTFFIHEDKARDYFRRGLPEWYLWWGNVPFTYETAWAVKTFEGKSRSLAQAGAMVEGVHPRIRILADIQNKPQVAALRAVRLHLWVAAGVLTLACACLLGCAGYLTLGRRGRRAGHRAVETPAA